MLAHGGGVADLPVAKAELVVGEPDGARIVRALGLLERLGQQRDRAGGFAGRDREAAVHAPQVGEPGRIEPLAPLGRRTKRLRGLPQVVEQQPGLCQCAADLDLLVATQSRLPQRADEQVGGVSSLTALQRLNGLFV